MDLKRLLNEPVLIGAAIRLSLIAAIAFGLSMTEQQMLALMAALEAFLALITRALVVPNGLAEARVDAGFRPTEKMNP